MTNFNGYLVEDIAYSILYRGASSILPGVTCLIEPLETQMKQKASSVCESILEDLKLYSEIEKCHINKLEPISEQHLKKS